MFEAPQDRRDFYQGGFSGGFFPYDPKIHHIRKVDFTEFLRRELNASNLEVYWHSESLNWVVTLLTDERGMPGLLELICLNFDPEGTSPCLTPVDVYRMKKMVFSPDTGKENSSIVKSMHRGDKRQADDRNREWINKWRYWGRKMNPVRQERCPEVAAAKRNRRMYG